MTYAFGRLQGLGNLPWHESELHSGQMLGNPSVSVEVSSYMCSLRRRKVRSLTNVENVLDTSACCSLGSGGRSCCQCPRYHIRQYQHSPL
jgi:hypothetical protein